MAVSRRKYNSQRTRVVLLGMMASEDVLQRASRMYTPGLFGVAYADTVASWCLEYFQEYERAPREDIEKVFYQKAEMMDESDVDVIKSLLVKASKEISRGDKLNAPYILKEMETLFKFQKAKQTATKVLDDLEEGDITAAESELVAYASPEIPRTTSINPYTDEEAIKRAFNVSREPLFRFPGDFGKQVNWRLVRGGFLALLGREKVGKTWMLDLFAHQAARGRCNVAFFSVGDMDEDEMIRRKHTGLTRIPSDPSVLGETYFVPSDIEQADDPDDHGNLGGGLNVVGEWEKCTRLLEASDAIKAGKLFGRRMRGRDFRLFTFPNYSINVQGIEMELDIAEKMDLFIPDVIVIDYADILAPEALAPREFRHAENVKWMRLRALAQKRNCLVIVATQADSASYDVITLGMSNFSEDKRKLSHVTGMMGLNKTETEMGLGVMRTNWIVLRGGRYTNSHCCFLLQCLEQGRPLIKSMFIQPREEEKSASSTKN